MMSISSFDQTHDEVRKTILSRTRLYAVAAIALVAACGTAVTVTAKAFYDTDSPSVTAVSLKGDRLASAAQDVCAHETWGNWTSACAAEISGKTHVRTILDATTETAAEAPNTSVLTRQSRTPHFKNGPTMNNHGAILEQARS